MNLKINKIKDIKDYYASELNKFYELEEVCNFLDMIFEVSTGLSRTGTALEPDKKLSEPEILKINFFVIELKKFRPIQYILGKTNFFGCKFFVNKSVLIPRPETEELVEFVLDELKTSNSKNFSIIDIGTGSGCIGILLKKRMPESDIWAVDISEEALKTAEKNAEINNVSLNFLKTDILNFTEHRSLPVFDVIVSNPPYVRESEKKQIHKNVLDYEPAIALFVDDKNSLKFYKAIIEFAKEHLKTGGKIYFEINENSGKEMTDLLKQNNYNKILIRKDIRGKNRIMRGEKKS